MTIFGWVSAFAVLAYVVRGTVRNIRELMEYERRCQKLWSEALAKPPVDSERSRPSLSDGPNTKRGAG